VGNNPEKLGLIPHDALKVILWRQSRKALGVGLASYQVVGRVMAYQADDG
jgi:hypothetical protein